MEQDLSEAIRNVFKASKALTELPECKAVADEVKKQMDEFKPIMPLVTALRNPGLRDRHWDKICQEVDFEVCVCMYIYICMYVCMYVYVYVYGNRWMNLSQLCPSSLTALRHP